MEISLSIIFPVYNVADYLEKCIHSFLNQNHPLKMELIFVDDGSTDNSREIINQYKKNDSRIKLYELSHSGSGASRNYGLEKAQYDYVYFADPDDWVEPDLFKTIEDSFSAHPNLDILAFGNNIYKNGKMIGKNTSHKEFLFSHIGDNQKEFLTFMNEHKLFSVWNKVYSKNFLNKNNLLFTRQRTGQDALFNIDVIKKANHLLIVNKELYNYVLQRKNSAQTAYNPLRIEDDKNVAAALENLFISYGLSKDLMNDYWVNIYVNDLRTKARHGEKLEKKLLKENRLKEIKYATLNGFKLKGKFFLYKNAPEILYQVLKYQ